MSRRRRTGTPGRPSRYLQEVIAALQAFHQDFLAQRPPQEVQPCMLALTAGTRLNGASVVLRLEIREFAPPLQRLQALMKASGLSIQGPLDSLKPEVWVARILAVLLDGAVPILADGLTEEAQSRLAPFFPETTTQWVAKLQQAWALYQTESDWADAQAGVGLRLFGKARAAPRNPTPAQKLEAKRKHRPTAVFVTLPAPIGFAVIEKLLTAAQWPSGNEAGPSLAARGGDATEGSASSVQDRLIPDLEVPMSVFAQDLYRNTHLQHPDKFDDVGEWLLREFLTPLLQDNHSFSELFPVLGRLAVGPRSSERLGDLMGAYERWSHKPAASWDRPVPLLSTRIKVGLHITPTFLLEEPTTGAPRAHVPTHLALAPTDRGYSRRLQTLANALRRPQANINHLELMAALHPGSQPGITWDAHVPQTKTVELSTLRPEWLTSLNPAL